MPKTQKQITGDLGEDISCEFLVKRGFSIICRNYRKKCGEIDIVAKKSGILHFIEVKTVSREICDMNVTRETVSSSHSAGGFAAGGHVHETDTYHAEDNLHPWKLERLAKTIQTYLWNECEDGADWEFGVIVVHVDQKRKRARVRFMNNIIL